MGAGGHADLFFQIQPFLKTEVSSLQASIMSATLLLFSWYVDVQGVVVFLPRLMQEPPILPLLQM